MSRFTLAVLVLALPATLRADEAEEKAVALVTELKGRIEREQARPDGPVVSVMLSGKEVTDETLKGLATGKR